MFIRWQLLNIVFFIRIKNSSEYFLNHENVIKMRSCITQNISSKTASKQDLNKNIKRKTSFTGRLTRLLEDLKLYLCSFTPMILFSSNLQIINIYSALKSTSKLAPVLFKLYNKCLTDSWFTVCWKTISVVPVMKNSGKPSDLSIYCSISHLHISDKVRDDLINTEWVKHLPSLILSDKQYVFPLSRPTADMLMAITKCAFQFLVKKCEARTVALTKLFDRGWHAGLLHKLNGYAVSGWIFRF